MFWNRAQRTVKRAPQPNPQIQCVRLHRWPRQLSSLPSGPNSSSPPLITDLPKHCSPRFVRRSFGGGGDTQLPLIRIVPANIPGRVIIWIMCQQCQQWKGGQRSDGTPGMGVYLLPEAKPMFNWWKSLNNSLLFASLVSHAAVPLFLTNVFSQNDKGKGWKDDSGEQERKRFY